ncbi:hypothetical protein [Streptomyces sp. NPDC051776]
MRHSKRVSDRRSARRTSQGADPHNSALEALPAAASMEQSAPPTEQEA